MPEYNIIQDGDNFTVTSNRKQDAASYSIGVPFISDVFGTEINVSIPNTIPFAGDLLYIQWSLRCKTPFCKTDLSYDTTLLPLQVVFLVQNAPRYETAPPRETASGLQKGQSYNAGTTVQCSTLSYFNVDA